MESRSPSPVGWIVVGVLGLAALGLAAGVAVWLGQQPPSNPEVVFVEATPSGLVTRDAAVVVPDAFVTVPPPTAPARDPREPDRTPRATGDSPGAIIDRLNAEVGRTLQHPELRKRFMTEGADTAHGTPGAFGAFFTAEIAQWMRVAKQAGITAQ